MKSFRIKNIKSFKDSGEIIIKPITIFVGKNSSGKSTLIRFPAVLSQTEKDEDTPISFNGTLVDFGYYDEVIRHGSDGKLGFEVKNVLDISRGLGYIDNQLLLRKLTSNSSRFFNLKKDFREVTMSVMFNKAEDDVFVDYIELYVENTMIYKISKTGDNTYLFHTLFTYSDGELVPQDFSVEQDDVTFKSFFPEFDVESTIREIYKTLMPNAEINEDAIEHIFGAILLSSYFISLDKEEPLSEKEQNIIDIYQGFNFCAGLLSFFNGVYLNECCQLKYIGPFRTDPQRYYRNLESFNLAVGVHGENTTNILIREYHKKSPKLFRMISEWTNKLLGYELTLRDLSNGMYQILLKDSFGVETNIIDNGYGISQVLPIITDVCTLSCMGMHKEKPFNYFIWCDYIEIIEQPELHLHPAAQSELADLFVNSILNGKGKKKILIETHSEHLIRKIQVLIANKDCELTNDMVAIYYIDKDDQGCATVEEMKILENGKFESPWPSGFFDKGYQLSRELARAGKES